MLNTLKEILTSDFGSFGFSFAFISLILWLAYKGGTLIEKYQKIDRLENNIETIKDDISVKVGNLTEKSKKIDKLENNIETIKDDISVKVGNLTEKSKKIDKLENSIDKIKDDISVIKASINVINASITVINDYINTEKLVKNGYSKSQSPIDLNTKGEAISDKLQAKKIIDANWPKIQKDITNQISQIGSITEANNLYTIQEICFKLCRTYSQYLSPEDINHIKNVAYAEGVTLSEFNFVFGIEVRNKYFEDNNIVAEAVTEYNPSSN